MKLESEVGFPGLNDPLVWIFLVFLGLSILSAVLWSAYKIWVGIDWVFRQKDRNIKNRTTTAFLKTVEFMRDELKAYNSDLRGFISQYRQSKPGSKIAYEAFRRATHRLVVVKVNSAVFSGVLSRLSPHEKDKLYLSAHSHIKELEGFCNTFREYYGPNNSDYLGRLQSYFDDSYFTAAIKPAVDLVMRKSHESEADKAVDYFERFLKVTDWAESHCASLVTDLTDITRQNKIFSIP